MIDFNLSDLVHRQIILDLTIRTIDRDIKHLDDLKISRSLTLWMLKQLTELQATLKEIKSELGKQGIKIQSENRVDAEITEYIIIERGQTHIRRYLNVALRNWVDEEVKRLLGLEYKTTKDLNEMKKPL